MHARVVTATLKRDKIDECIRIGRDSIVPEAKRQQGFRDHLFLADRASGHCMLFSLWESETDLHASETSGYYTAQVAKLQPLFVSPPLREIGTVTVHELGGLTSGTRYGRVTTAMHQHGKIDDDIRVFRDAIVPEAKKQQGFKGMLQVVDRDTGKDFVLSCWESEADLQAGESSGYYQAQTAKRLPFLIGQPTRETFELTLPTLVTPPPPPSMDAQAHPPAP